MSTHLRAVSLRALLLALLIPTAALANTAGELQHLQSFHLAAQKSLGDFYMYNGMELSLIHI